MAMDSGNYAPTGASYGNFTIMQLSGNATAKATSFQKEDFVGKYALSNRILTDREKAMVPTLPDWYIIPKEVVRVCEHAKATTASNQPMRNFLFRGEAGTGKTMGAQAIAAGLNLPYTLMTCSANTEITDLVGQFIPDTNGFHGSTPIEDLPKISDITMHPPSVYMMLTGEYDESKTEDDVLQKLIEIAVGNLMEKEDPAGQRIRYPGCWEGRYTAGYDILTGKRIQKGVFAKTRKECAAKLARAIQQDTGPYYRKGKGYDSQPLSTWIRLWFDSYTKPNLRPSSADGYRSMIENHIIPVLGHIQLSKLSSIQIQRFYNDLHTQGRLDNHGNRKYEPLSASTVKHIHAVLSGALKQAVKERIIPFNPCDNCKIPKREKKEMHVLPQDKIGAYLDEAKRLGVYALFYLELTSGLRRGELLGLEWADLNPETRMLTVNKQLTRSGGELCISVPKTENSIRTIALPENTVALLIDEHNKHPDSPLMFWCPRTNGYWSPDSLRHLHKQMLAAAGVDESVRFHDLRHTFSTLAIQSGVDAKTVAGMLGHYSAAFTLDTYTHVTEQMKRGAAEKIGVFMNASVNVQVNVVHSPSAVVRGDYESDLANCLNPSNSTDLDPTSQ